MSDEIIRLDEEQKRVVESPKGDSIIIKSASGTGKTKVLIERIIHLINEGTSPENILVLLATTDEEEEVRKILKRKFKDEEKIPRLLGTFVNVFTIVLRKYITKIDSFRNEDFQIISPDQQNKKMRSIGRSLKIGALLDLECSQVKRMFIDIRTTGKTEMETMHLKGDNIYSMYKQYQDFINSTNQVDIDEVLLLAHKLMVEHKEIRDEFTNQYQFILVDEIQDLEEEKWNLLSLLLKDGHTSFLGVGDPHGRVLWNDGSIPDIYKKIEEVLPKTVTKSLTKNWRSTKAIVDFTNELMKGKREEVAAAKESEVGVEYYINEKIGVEQIVESTEYSTWVILYRFDKWLPRIQQALEEKGIPYHMKDAIHDQNQYNRENSVSLVSIYNCKGLEWDNVIIWKYKSLTELLSNPEDLSLVYVAASRAKERLLLCKSKEKKPAASA